MSATNGVVWTGSQTLQLQPDIRDTESADSRTTVLSYRGPYSECKKLRPMRGQQIVGVNGYVATTEITRHAAGLGTLTVTVVAQYSQGEGEAVPAEMEITYELKWQECTKALIEHPRYSAKNAGYGSAAFGDAVTADTLSSADSVLACSGISVGQFILSFENESAQKAEEEILKCNNNDQKSLMRDYMKKRARNQDGYKVFIPVLSKVTTTTTRPSATGAGMIVPAPTTHPLYNSIGDATGRTWFKDADDVTATGRFMTYQRTEVWIGADEVDTDLYRHPTAP